MEKIERFRIAVAQDVLDDLHRRIQNTRWLQPPASDADWDRGIDLRYLKELTDYWLYDYDWRAREEALNRSPQYKANLGAYRIHFIQEGGKDAYTMPLLLLHGWPDSFYRFHKIVPYLTDSGFDVVIPSLPGFGFTECPPDRNSFHPVRHDAELLWTLMTRVLGYERFGIVGGDGGSPLAQLIAIDHPESVIGIYLTDLGWQAATVDQSTLTRREKNYLQSGQKEFMRQGAYAMQQSTRPQTLAYSLNDSPVGLAAWILDRFYFWSDTDGDIEKSFSKDELLTNIMIYWVTGTMPTSILNYALDTRSPSLKATDRVETPVGLGLFPKEAGGIPPREFAARTLNVRHWTEMKKGGHFTAWEEPEAMAGDVHRFFSGFTDDYFHQE